MAKNKTIETENSVTDFLATISNAKRREDCMLIIDLLSKVSEFEPKMWGASIVGFGIYNYKYESGIQEMHHLQDWHQGKTLLRCIWLRLLTREKSYFHN
jgi:hypothetical protein